MVENDTKNLKIFWSVKEEDRCPFYEENDLFILDNLGIETPPAKKVCLSLMRAVAEKTANGRVKPVETELTCYGFREQCKGKITLRSQNTRPIKRPVDKRVFALIDTIKNLSFFKNFPDEDLESLVPLLVFNKHKPGQCLLRKGTETQHVFIVASGTVIVVDGDTILAELGPGEVFGEMSHLNDTTVGATVLVKKTAWIIKIQRNKFQKLLVTYPDLQMYFIKLLTRRLADTNRDRTTEFNSGMAGKLADLPPVELFELFNHNHKTGILQMKLPRGVAELFFNKGQLLKVQYALKNGAEAFYEILKEDRGRFRFIAGSIDSITSTEPIGDFMWLLLEGLKRLDEEKMTVPNPA